MKLFILQSTFALLFRLKRIESVSVSHIRIQQLLIWSLSPEKKFVRFVKVCIWQILIGRGTYVGYVNKDVVSIPTPRSAGEGVNNADQRGPKRKHAKYFLAHTIFF